MKKSGPYVGVTGFMSVEEVVTAAKCLSESTRKLMVGVLVSSKTLAREENRWPGRYPQIQKISEVFLDLPNVLNLVHYSTDDPEALFPELTQVSWYAGPRCHGFQLNACWPSVPSLGEYRRSFPSQYIVLQIGSRAMEVAKTPEGVAQYVARYGPLIDAILVDGSGGTGKPLDAALCIQYLRAIRRVCPQVALGVAGGLGGADTVRLLSRFAEEEYFDNLNIDAEGRLRSPGDDSLDLRAVETYLEDTRVYW